MIPPAHQLAELADKVKAIRRALAEVGRIVADLVETLRKAWEVLGPQLRQLATWARTCPPAIRSGLSPAQALRERQRWRDVAPAFQTSSAWQQSRRGSAPKTRGIR